MTFTIALAGDTMLGRGVGAEIDAVGPGELVCGEIRDLIRSADLAVVNLECCISNRGQPFPGQRFPFRGPPQAASVLADLGVRCVTLANNHVLDFGPLALADTVSHLAAAGISVTGAGHCAARARAPAMLTAGGLVIAVLGVTDHPAEYAAAAGHPGVAYADLRSGVPDWLTDQVQAAGAQADVVLVSPHWGQKMTIRPLPYVRSAASALIAAGATLVAGHSAHLFHGVADRVLYDLGDFVDDYAVDPVVRNDLGLLFLVTVSEHGPEHVTAVPLRLHYARTEDAAGADRDLIAARFTRACADLGTTVIESNGTLNISLSPRRLQVPGKRPPALAEEALADPELDREDLQP
jgi:poly-gamma-glutamate synthesis protein (capsule biosynthesis protein)